MLCSIVIGDLLLLLALLFFNHTVGSINTKGTIFIKTVMFCTSAPIVRYG